MFDPKTVQFRGPLVAHVEGFWSELMRQEYTPLSGGNLLRLAAHLKPLAEGQPASTEESLGRASG